ncbi:mannosidase, alpha, class 2B, member [Cichlidogyrus casuarinus]|uniref:Mannosidase, alpha, class 2B, member n=1 Tax=Cichlidogyrus casuarinus TaxID=1844966 RepID=A0ABD2QGQ6_9PLAT
MLQNSLGFGTIELKSGIVTQDLFGECGRPRVAWQIDPFGHSRDQARIFRDAGFDGVYFQRMDYREKQYRRQQQALELLWLTDPQARVNASRPNSHSFFTGIFYDSYCYPATFCLDELCQDEVFVDDSKSSESNAKLRTQSFISYLNGMANSFATENVIVPMGCDFTYQNAHKNFHSTDVLIKFANQLYDQGKSRYKLVYSTPDCYTLAVNKAFNRRGQIPQKDGDFFPYASEGDRYWTGFYTSRPTFKYYVRKSSNELRLCEQVHFSESAALLASTHRLQSQMNFAPSAELQRQVDEARQKLQANNDAIDALRKTVGLSLHHDAITGTAKQQVAFDYVKTLRQAGK